MPFSQQLHTIIIPQEMKNVKGGIPMLYEDPRNNLEEELEYYRMIGIYDVTDGDDYEDYRDYWEDEL